jgi:hypothetical protein
VDLPLKNGRVTVRLKNVWPNWRFIKSFFKLPPQTLVGFNLTTQVLSSRDDISKTTPPSERAVFKSWFQADRQEKVTPCYCKYVPRHIPLRLKVIPCPLLKTALREDKKSIK